MFEIFLLYTNKTVLDSNIWNHFILYNKTI